MYKATIYIAIVITLTACGRRFNSKEQEELQKLVIQKNEEIFSQLTDKYSIKYSLDTLSYDYSIEYEDMLSTKYQLINRFRILDIYKHDSISYVQIEAGFFPTYFLNLRISDADQEKLLKLGRAYFFNAVLVVSLQEIRNIHFTFRSCPEAPESNSIEVGSSMSFAGKGEVIEVYMLNE